jgi:hypothetical protein
MAINQAAQGLRQQGLEQQRWETEQDFRERQFEYGQEQDAFNNYVTQRQLELQQQGMAFEQAQAQAEFEYEKNRDAINDDFRKWQTSMMYGGRGTSGTGGTATPQEDSFDIRAYTPMLNNLYQQDPGQVIPYINNLEREGVPQEAIQELRRIYGVQSTTTPTSQSQQGRVGGRMDMGGTTSSSVITPYIPPEPQFQEEPEEINYPLSYLEAKEDVLSTATDMNGNVNAEIVAQQVDALVAAGQISPDVAMAIYSPYAQQE